MWYKKSVEEVMSEFRTNEEGLSFIDAGERFKVQGKNELPKTKQITIWHIILEQLTSPINIILFIAIILSLIIGEFIDSIFIIFVIFIDVVLGTIQEWKAVNSASLLNDTILVKHKVIREGDILEIDSVNLVTGDIVLLESGDKVAADMRLFEVNNLTVDEAILTGESITTEKNIETINHKCVINDQKNMVFTGTSIIRGRAKAIVVATKDNTEFGKIAKTVINDKHEKTPLVLRMEKFTSDISRIIIVVSIVLIIALLLRGEPIQEVLFIAIALSISAIPEGLPVVMTMCLTIASNKMLKRNVLVKRLNSVESLGSCTVIASDKTGTLTLNEQTAKVILFPNNKEHKITGIGYNSNGTISNLNDNVREIAYLGFINNEANLELNNNKWEHFGDSIDIAFKAMAYKAEVNEVPNVIDIIPYESDNKYSGLFYKEGQNTYCTIKGSVETVLEYCTKEKSGKTIKKLNKKGILAQNEYLASLGYRVIALATGKVKNNKKDYNEKDISSLTFIGLVGFIDPLREDAISSIKKCQKAGIKTIMITGDHPLTSLAIGKELKLTKSIDDIATGEEVSKYFELGEEEFIIFVKSKTIFARVSPLQKYDIINALKKSGEFVAVTGDGVNDAPALKTANIGIAIGSGTDVAKETSTMIITDNSFSSIVHGVEEGRVAYSNIRKVIYMLLSCGVAEVLFFLLSIIFGYEIPLIAIQLLWLNLVTDGIQDVALAYEKKNYDVMSEPPRRPNERIFNKKLIEQVLVSGTYIALVVFLVWIFLIDYKGMPIDNARGYIILLMVFMQNFHVFNCRSEEKSAFKIPLKNNYFIVVAIIAVLVLQMIVSEVPMLSSLLKTQTIPWNHALILAFLSMPIIFVMDAYKKYKRKKS